MAEHDRPATSDPDVLRHHYEQVCVSYRAIDDFRGKLLALWPILGGAAGGLALLASNNTNVSQIWAVGLVGFSVSVGLAVYEWNQTLRCDQLKKVARSLEWQMRLTPGTGQFLSLPQGYELFTLVAPDPPETPWDPESPAPSPPGSSIWAAPVRVGVASLIVYGSVIVGWLSLVIWGVTQ
jgi:hypothetical protein